MTCCGLFTPLFFFCNNIIVAEFLSSATGGRQLKDVCLVYLLYLDWFQCRKSFYLHHNVNVYESLFGEFLWQQLEPNELTINTRATTEGDNWESPGNENFSDPKAAFHSKFRWLNASTVGCERKIFLLLFSSSIFNRSTSPVCSSLFLTSSYNWLQFSFADCLLLSTV